ncbi:MAG: hypothetical protein DWQ02_02345 [Bacteroidetes bacterium]|nr:MAG: hypothetical protein DWQ02_02345 [Bacteroidota bacterium]
MNGKIKSANGFAMKLEAYLNPSWINKRNASIILGSILIFTAIVRISTIDSPALDRTDWKEIDHIMISKNYYENGYKFLYPEVDWPAENPRYTAMELPIAPFIAGLLYGVFGYNVYTVRILTFFAFLLLIFFSYKLVRREAGLFLALMTALLAGILPLSNQFNKYLFSEPLLLFFSVFSVFYYAEWVDKKKVWQLVLFIIGFSLAISLKPTCLYLGLPLLWIHYRANGLKLKRYLSFFLTMIVCLILPVWWYSHAYYLANNYIDVFGVFGGQFGGHDKFQTIGMLSDPQWWATMYFRMKRMLLGNMGLLMLAIGVVYSAYSSKGRLFLYYLLSVLLFFMIVAEGNLDTTYRQLTIIPPAAFFISLGFITTSTFLYHLAKRTGAHKMTCKILAVAIPLGLLLFFPLKRFDIYEVPNKETAVHKTNWLLAEQIKINSPGTKKMVLAGGYTTHKGGNDLSPILYYYSDLQGWSIQEGEWEEETIEKYFDKGATIFAATGYSREEELAKFVQTLKTKYKIIYYNPEKGLLLLDLTQKL